MLFSTMFPYREKENEEGKGRGGKNVSEETEDLARKRSSFPFKTFRERARASAILENLQS